MGIKNIIDQITGATTPSANIRDAIDRWTGTEEKSKTIAEAVAKIDEPTPEEPEEPDNPGNVSGPGEK